MFEVFEEEAMAAANVAIAELEFNWTGLDEEDEDELEEDEEDDDDDDEEECSELPACPFDFVESPLGVPVLLASPTAESCALIAIKLLLFEVVCSSEFGLVDMKRLPVFDWLSAAGFCSSSLTSAESKSFRASVLFSSFCMMVAAAASFCSSCFLIKCCCCWALISSIRMRLESELLIFIVGVLLLSQRPTVAAAARPAPGTRSSRPPQSFTSKHSVLWSKSRH